MGGGGFPRFCAAASLKLAACAPFSAAYERFPRFCAAASLKRYALSLLDEAGYSFSAVLCRGLIEATAWAPASPAASPVFRGFVPRPH